MLSQPGNKRNPTLTQAELNGVMASHERYVLGRGGLRAQLGHKVLDGLNLANRNLTEADFAGASLVGANLFGSNLERASFYCADLRDCNLRVANLMRADLRGASFSGAQLGRANLDNADLRSATMMLVGPDGVNIVGDGKAATRTGTSVGVDFSNCSLKYASFGNAKLDGANFTGALLQGANFKGAKLTNASFRGAVLTGVALKDLNVRPEALEGCVKDVSPEAVAKFDALKAKIDGHQAWLSSGGANGNPANIDGEDLRPAQNLFVGRSLAGLSARGVVAIGIDFSGSSLQAIKFDGADLRDCNFTQADLRGASLRSAKLAHANFDKADLGSLHMANGADLHPDFAGSDVVQEQLRNSHLVDALSALGVTVSSTA